MSELYNALYERLDRYVMTSERVARVERCASRYGGDPDEWVADLRLAFWRGFRAYDWTRSHGQVQAFAERITSNAIKNGIRKTLRRRPTVELDEDRQGVDSESEGLGLSLIQLLSSARADLDGRALEVFDLRFNPTSEYLAFLRNSGLEANNLAVARYLGVTKNQYDYAWASVMAALGRRLLEPQFAELLDDVVSERGWPWCGVSESAHDAEFVQASIRRFRLDPRPSAPTTTTSRPTAHRIVETYPWGVVGHLRWKRRSATLVAVGEVNWRFGVVHREEGEIRIQDVWPWVAPIQRKLAEPDRNWL